MAVEYLEVVYSKPRGILEELGGGEIEVWLQ